MKRRLGLFNLRKNMFLNPHLAYFAKLIETELGIVYTDKNEFQLQNRLEELVKKQGLSSVGELYELSHSGGALVLKQQLFDLATNNETSFFRDPKYFLAFKNKVLEMGGDPLTNFPLKIWSAASSTGQEAVSIGIILNEIKKKYPPSFSYSIRGTDISDKALSKAKSFSYTELETERGLSADLLRDNLSRQDSVWKVNKCISDNIVFEKLNLLSADYPGGMFHFIFCRNVLIYQTVERKIEILSKLRHCLLPGGYLILGVGESLLGLQQNYETEMIDGAFLYKKPYHAEKK
jgi:chemotaxis protein methyltransferase CheR